eukprot:2436222-Ditylum_brightwellii.AAC.1
MMLPTRSSSQINGSSGAFLRPSSKNKLALYAEVDENSSSSTNEKEEKLMMASTEEVVNITEKSSDSNDEEKEKLINDPLIKKTSNKEV